MRNPSELIAHIVVVADREEELHGMVVFAAKDTDALAAVDKLSWVDEIVALSYAGATLGSMGDSGTVDVKRGVRMLGGYRFRTVIRHDAPLYVTNEPWIEGDE